MKTLFTLSLALLASSQCLAQTSRYDGSVGSLEIPCVELYRNDVPVLNAEGKAATYKAQMHTSDTSRFWLYSATLAVPTDECLARYDSATGVYTDLVSLANADKAYRTIMTQGPDGAFTLTSALLAGPAKTSLWVVTDGTRTLYLGGAMYAMRASDYPVPGAFEEAYGKSSSVYFEIDMDDPAETGINLTPAQRSALMTDPQGKLLNEVLHPDVYSNLVSYLQIYSVPINEILTWSAQMVSDTFLADGLRLLADATSESIDTYFASKAIADSKPIFGLETAATRRTISQAANEGIENNLIYSTLVAIDAGDASDLLTQLAAWRRGDVATTQQASEALRTGNRKDYDLVYTNRINAWLPKIETLLTTADTELVLVGPTYLAGPDGLVTRLRNRGYTVTKY